MFEHPNGRLHSLGESAAISGVSEIEMRAQIPKVIANRDKKTLIIKLILTEKSHELLSQWQT